MLHMISGRKYWYRQRSYGMGAFPNTWQGWAFLGLFLAFVAGMAVNAERNGETPALWWLGLIVVTALFVFIVWKKTEGGWQWGWGSRP